MRSWLMGAVSVVVLAAVGGCAPYDKMRSELHKSAAEADLQQRDGMAPHQAVDVRNIRITEGLWLGNRAVDTDNGDRLPSDLPHGGLVEINSAGEAMTLREIATELTAQSGIKVDVEDVVMGMAGQPAVLGNKLSPRLEGGMALLVKRRPLGEALNSIAAYYGIEWEYSARTRRIRMFAYETKTFELASLPTELKAHMQMGATGHGSNGASQTAAVGGAGGGAAAQGTNSAASLLQDADVQVKVDTFKATKEAIEAMVGPNGSVKVTGTQVIVTGPRFLLRKVEALIRDANEWALRQVAINVKVFKIHVTDGFNLGANLGAAFQSVASAYQLGLNGAVPDTIANSAGLNFAVLPTSEGGKPTQWANSKVVFQALRTLGDVELKNEGAIAVRNGRLGFYGGQKDEDYVYSLSQNNVANVGSQVSVTPATLETGFTMMVQPLIQRDGRVILGFTTSLSDPGPLRQGGNPGAEIELATVTSDKVLQDVVVDSGDYLVMAGFSRSNRQANESGLPGVGALLGGGVGSSSERDIVVALVQPIILGTRGRDAF